MKMHDLAGKRFGKLRVVKFTGINPKNRCAVWECICDCGSTATVDSKSLVSGNTKSCGCGKNAGHRKYGSKTTHENRLYRIWIGMRDRCKNKQNSRFSMYGGRGIEVCEAWDESFTTFRDWALRSGYQESLTIDRINNDHGHSPENCRWATLKTQANNRRNSHYIKFRGECKTISQWAETLDIPEGTLRSRIWNGWPTAKALTKPVRKMKCHKKS